MRTFPANQHILVELFLMAMLGFAARDGAPATRPGWARLPVPVLRRNAMAGGERGRGNGRAWGAGTGALAWVLLLSPTFSSP